VAEGARFELADPLRGLRFSRPARSAAPSPLQLSFITWNHRLVVVAASECSLSEWVLEVAAGLAIGTKKGTFADRPGAHHDVDGLHETSASRTSR
jgi:hypothetical protein